MALVDRRKFSGHEVVMLNPDRGRRLAASMIGFQAKHPSAATNAHVFRERNFGRHDESDFYSLPRRKRKIGPQKGTAGTQIEGEAGAGVSIGGVQKDGYLVLAEPVSAAAFDPGWFRLGHVAPEHCTPEKADGEVTRK